MNTGEAVKVLTGHEHNVSGVCFLPSGDRIVSVSRDNTIKVWEVSSGLCKITLREPGWIRRVVCNRDGTLIATCNSDNVSFTSRLYSGHCLILC